MFAFWVFDMSVETEWYKKQNRGERYSLDSYAFEEKNEWNIGFCLSTDKRWSVCVCVCVFGGWMGSDLPRYHFGAYLGSGERVEKVVCRLQIRRICIEPMRQRLEENRRKGECERL